MIFKCIEKCSIYGETLHFGEIYDLLKGINKEIEKSSIGNWLSIPEIYTIYTSHINEEVTRIKETKITDGPFLQAFGEKAAKALSSVISDYIASIPRQYSVCLHILTAPSTIPAITEISANVFLESSLPFQISTETIPGKVLQAFSPFMVKNVVLRQNINGYCGGSLDNPSNRQSLSSFKVLLQQALFKGALITNNRTFKLFPETETPDHRIKKYSLAASETGSQRDNKNTATLPIEMCAYLEKIRLPQKKTGTIAHNNDDELNALIKNFKVTGQLLDCKDKEAVRVRAAIEWSFDADTAETSTMSFIKTCIGLEALLGDDSQKGPLTETLADRCGYLIGKTIKDRSRIKSRFKEIYTTRSKIVHGVTTHLTHEELINLHHGKLFLKKAIQAEISHLEIKQ